MTTTNPDKLRRKGATALTAEEATAQAEHAHGLVTALEERVRNGDPAVSSDHIAHARSQAGFAQLQADAARRREEEAQRKGADDAMRNACDAARTLAQDGSMEVEALRRAAADAFASYLDVLDKVTFQASQVREVLQQANLQAESLGLESCTSHGVWLGNGVIEVSGSDAVVTLTTTRHRPLDTLAGVVAEAGFVLQPFSTDTPIGSTRPWPPTASVQ